MVVLVPVLLHLLEVLRAVVLLRPVAGVVSSGAGAGSRGAAAAVISGAGAGSGVAATVSIKAGAGSRGGGATAASKKQVDWLAGQPGVPPTWCTREKICADQKVQYTE